MDIKYESDVWSLALEEDGQMSWLLGKKKGIEESKKVLEDLIQLMLTKTNFNIFQSICIFWEV